MAGKLESKGSRNLGEAKTDRGEKRKRESLQHPRIESPYSYRARKETVGLSVCRNEGKKMSHLTFFPPPAHCCEDKWAEPRINCKVVPASLGISFPAVLAIVPHYMVVVHD